MNQRNVPVAVRLAGGFAAVALIVLLLGLLAIQGMSNMRAEAEKVEKIWLPSLQSIGGFNQDFMRFRIFTLRAMLAEDPREIQQLDQSMREVLNNLERAEQRSVIIFRRTQGAGLLIPIRLSELSMSDCTGR